jgi:hypothetical protein
MTEETVQAMYGMSEYQAAVQGLIPKPSQERRDELYRVKNLDELLEASVQKLWEAPTFGWPPRDWVCAWDYIWENMRLRYPKSAQYDPDRKKRFKDRMHLRVMSLATDIARTSPRAWGVQDPSKEAYCSSCKGPRPIEDFEEGYATCMPCLTKKRRARR